MSDLFILLAGIVILLIGVGALMAKENGTERSGRVVFVGCMVAACICFGLAFSFRLGANEVGIPVSVGRIGAPQGPGGMHVKAPWTNIEKLSVLPYTADAIDVRLRTNEGGEFAARFTPRWHTTKDAATDLYRNRRTSDEATITKQVVNPLLGGMASEIAKTLDNDATLDAKGAVIRQGVTNTSTLTFARTVQDVLTPRLLTKGIVLDDLTINGDFTLSDTMRSALANLAASKSRTKNAVQDVQTAVQEAAAAKARAAGARDATAEIPATVTAQQVAMYCAQVWAAEAKRATEKGVSLYTVPCGSAASTAGILVGK
jgi:hypothetical protein